MIRFYFKRLIGQRTALAGLVAILLLVCAGIGANILSPCGPSDQHLVERLSGPNARYLLGTDDLGRDVLSRMLHGIRVSMGVGIVAVGIMVVIGTLLGLIAGYFGGFVDSVIMRFVDIMLCFPTFFLILIVIAFLEPSLYTVMGVIGITSWPGLARLVRAEVLSLRERDYIAAANMLGISRIRLFFVHLLPNVISPVIVAATLGVGDAILTESGLSFLGLGVQPPIASWGQMLTTGKEYIHIAWWLSLFPGCAILITVLAFNLLGEGLRDALDPKRL